MVFRGECAGTPLRQRASREAGMMVEDLRGKGEDVYRKAGGDLAGGHGKNEEFEAGADSQLCRDEGVPARPGGVLTTLHGGWIIWAKVLSKISSQCEWRVKWITSL